MPCTLPMRSASVAATCSRTTASSEIDLDQLRLVGNSRFVARLSSLLGGTCWCTVDNHGTVAVGKHRADPVRQPTISVAT